MAQWLTEEVKQECARLIAHGGSPTQVGKALGISRISVWRVTKDPQYAEVIKEARLARIDALEAELDKQAFHEDTMNPVKFRAVMELLKALKPDTYDPTYRRRRIEADSAYLFNPRVQYQRYMDERDERIQEENARRAMADRQADIDPDEDIALDHVLLDLRTRRLRAGQEAAKEADDYVKPNGSGNKVPPDGAD